MVEKLRQSRKIKVLRDFFRFVGGQAKDKKMPRLDKVVLPNRISKMQNPADLHNYLSNSVIFHILPIQIRW